jgi:hypothetical protein
VRGSGVCTAANGFEPLTGRRTHLGLHCEYIASITSCRKAHWPHETTPALRSKSEEPFQKRNHLKLQDPKSDYKKHHQASGAIGNVGTPSIFRVAVSIFRAPR